MRQSRKSGSGFEIDKYGTGTGMASGIPYHRYRYVVTLIVSYKLRDGGGDLGLGIAVGVLIVYIYGVGKGGGVMGYLPVGAVVIFRSCVNSFRYGFPCSVLCKFGHTLTF